MIKPTAIMVAAATLLVAGPAVRAQVLDPGARAGNSYVPSTHSPGCGGIMCDSDDPRRAAAVAPPPCEGLLCVVSPFAMQRPVTAGDARRIQEEQARAAAAAPPPATPAARGPHKRRKARTAGKAKSVATRTPDPGAAATDAR